MPTLEDAFKNPPTGGTQQENTQSGTENNNTGTTKTIPIVRPGRSKPLGEIVQEAKDGRARMAEANAIAETSDFDFMTEVSQQVERMEEIKQSLPEEEPILLQPGQVKTLQDAAMAEVIKQSTPEAQAQFLEQELINDDPYVVPPEAQVATETVAVVEPVTHQPTPDFAQHIASPVMESVEATVTTSQAPAQPVQPVVMGASITPIVSDPLPTPNEEIDIFPTAAPDEVHTAQQKEPTMPPVEEIPQIMADDTKKAVEPVTGDMSAKFDLQEETTNEGPILDEVTTLQLEDLDLRSTEHAQALVIPLSDAETIEQAAADANPKAYEELVRTDQKILPFYRSLQAAAMDDTTYLHRLHRANEQFFTNQQKFNRTMLEAAARRNKGIVANMTSSAKVSDTMVTDAYADKNAVLKKYGNNAVIQGAAAVRAAALLTQYVRKINLYNSGFYIVCRAPFLSELAEYWRDCSAAVQEYGYILGQLSYLPASIYRKQAALKLIEAVTIESNLEGYNTPGMLRKAISFLDFEPILWGIGSLMFPKGLKVDHMCHEGNCRYMESANISVNDMRYNDWTLLSADAITFTSSKKSRSLDDLKEYRTKIGTLDVSTKIDNQWSASLRIPTMEEYEEANLAYISEMAKTIQLSAMASADMYVNTKYFSILAPFASVIDYRNPENGQITHFNGNNMAQILDALQSGSVHFSKVVDDFISRVKVTHICHTFNKCPKCGKLPSAAIGNLIPCDVESTFFTLAVSKIQELADTM